MMEQQSEDCQIPPGTEETPGPLWFSAPSCILETLPTFAEISPCVPDTGISTTLSSPSSSDMGFFSLDFNKSTPSIHNVDNVANSWSSQSHDFNSLSQTFIDADCLSSGFDSPVYDVDANSWHTNTHRGHSSRRQQHALPRRRSRYILRKPANETKIRPIMIPNGNHASHSNRLQPLALQRWQNSPPEQEAASLSAIYSALENESNNIMPNPASDKYRNHFCKYRSPSSRASTDSIKSDSSLWSCNSSQSATSQTKRRSQAKASRTKPNAKGRNMLAAGRIFKCTFCCDTFKHKYDWARHERSLHLSMEEWTCTPHGGTVMLPLTGRLHCAYCNALDPSPEHLEEHNHSACLQGRTFRRKDHLVQHLRLVHSLETLPLIHDWKVESMSVTSRCGFCNITLNSWDERIDHLAAHFREGKTMADWRGEHGFDSAITARLTHAFPPYLIDTQSKTMVPFSATDPASLDQTKQLQKQIDLLPFNSPDLESPTIQEQAPSIPQEVDTVVFADILARHLSKYARGQMLAGILPTDEMFQREARRVLYQDGDDEWNQTPADNQQWLENLRTRTGFSGT